MAQGTSDQDDDHLTPEQQNAIFQLTEVTGQEVRDALPLLERSNWSVTLAIARFFDGEESDPEVEDNEWAELPNLPSVLSARRSLQDSYLRPTTDFARRVVPPRTSTFRLPFVLALFVSPLRLCYSVLANIFGLFGRLMPLVTPLLKLFKWSKRRPMLPPSDTAARFRREFEDIYGHNNLPWFEGGFAAALDCAKNDVKYLLFTLLSPEHDDTDAFVRGTLLEPRVVAFLNDPSNRIVLWGGNLQDSEAFQVSQEHHCTKFPFSALVCLAPNEGGSSGISTRMGIAKRLIGPLVPHIFLANIRGAMDKHDAALAVARAERDTQQHARLLREQQDRAYERSLVIDRERARARREAAAAKALEETRRRKEEEHAAQFAKIQDQWRKWRVLSIPPEPPVSASSQDVVRLTINLPGDAGKVTRRFDSSATFDDLYAFVECRELLDKLLDKQGSGDSSEELPAAPRGYSHDYEFQIVSLLPREVYEPNLTVTIMSKIKRGGNLIVEEV